MIDFSKPVQTRNGKKARILCTNRKHAYYPVVALIEGEDEEDIMMFTKNGHCFAKNGLFSHGVESHPRDLVQAPYHHTHHDVIIAWAKGAKIEYRRPNFLDEAWKPIFKEPYFPGRDNKMTPHFWPEFEYRVKP